MKHIAKAFAPANISCIFNIHEDPDPAKAGSTGLGFTLDKGVTVAVSFAEKTEIFFNEKKINFPTVDTVIGKLLENYSSSEYSESRSVLDSHRFSTSLSLRSNNIKVNITSPLPLGCGFGLSGASALATAYALNELLGLKKEKIELAKIAHVAEVENKTGLGDVVNQYFGGFLLKTENSSAFKVHRIPIENIPVYCQYFSELSTKSVLSDISLRKKIDTAAMKALEKIKERIMNHESRIKEKKNTKLFADLISISKEFAKKSGLLKDQQVMNTIQEIESRGGHASMIMLGNAVFSDTHFPEGASYSISTKNAQTI